MADTCEPAIPSTCHWRSPAYSAGSTLARALMVSRPGLSALKTTRLSAGRYWRQATEKQRTELADAFRGTLVRTYSGALTRVEQLEALKLKKEQLSFSLVSYLDPDAALKLDSSINSDILALRQSVAGGEYGSAEEQLTSLKGIRYRALKSVQMPFQYVKMPRLVPIQR